MRAARNVVFGFSFLAASCSLHGQLSTPNVGFVRYQGLPVQRLYGVAGNLVPAGTALGPARTASFCEAAGMIATDDEVRLLRPDTSVLARFTYRGTAAPLLNIGTDITSAVAWLPATSTLLHWNGQTLEPVKLEPSLFAGNISSVSLPAKDIAEFLVIHPDRNVSTVRVSLASGNVLSSDILPGVRGPAFRFGSYVIWSDGQNLQAESAGSVQRAFPLKSSKIAAERMSSRWMHIFDESNNAHYALDLKDSEGALWRIPIPRVPSAEAK